jgi:hypothetical protein
VAIGALSGPEPGPAMSLPWETGERRRAMARFSDRMVPEVVQVFWAAMARGEFITAAAAGVGAYREKGMRWLRAEGGVRPRRVGI